MESRRSRSLDPARVPVPETPDDGSTLELIGQEMVIHRTVHQSSHQPSPGFSAPTSSALVTPTRMVTRATRALTDGTEGGSAGGERPREPESLEMVHPNGSPQAFGPEASTPGTGGQLPLFNQDQLGRLHNLQMQAPLLYGGAVGGPPVRSDPPVQVPRMVQMSPGPLDGSQGDPRFSPEQVRSLSNLVAQRNQLLTQEVERLERENIPLRAQNFSLREEQQALKQEIDRMKRRLSLVEVQAGTPVFVSPDQGEVGQGASLAAGSDALQNDLVGQGASLAAGSDALQNAQVSQNVQVTSNDLMTPNVKVLKNDLMPRPHRMTWLHRMSRSYRMTRSLSLKMRLRTTSLTCLRACSTPMMASLIDLGIGVVRTTSLTSSLARTMMVEGLHKAQVQRLVGLNQPQMLPSLEQANLKEK